MIGRNLLFQFFLMLFVAQINAQPLKLDSLSNASVIMEEFELLNFCHCVEYIEINNYKTRPDILRKYEHQIFSLYNSSNRNNQYYDSLYKHSLFFKRGISSYFENRFDYTHLDSLYYMPIVDYYRNDNIKRKEGNTFNGLKDHNAFFDCYYKIKEIPWKAELRNFLIRNWEAIAKTP